MSEPKQQAPASPNAYIGVGTKIGGINVGIGIPVGGGPKKKSYLWQKTKEAGSAAVSFPVNVMTSAIDAIAPDDDPNWVNVRWRVYALIILCFPLGLYAMHVSEVFTKTEKICVYIFLVFCYFVGRATGH